MTAQPELRRTGSAAPQTWDEPPAPRLVHDSAAAGETESDPESPEAPELPPDEEPSPEREGESRWVERQDLGLRRRRRGLSPLTWRILLLNALAIAIPVIGLLYLDEYRNNLVQAELSALRTEGEFFAGALAASGVVFGPLGEEKLLPETTRHTVQRFVRISRNRARLFGPDGELLADSFRLAGAGGEIQVETLPPLKPVISELASEVYAWFESLLPKGVRPPIYHENAEQRAEDYPEVVRALAGQPASAVRSTNAGGMVLSVAVPVQRYRRVLGAIFISTNGQKIDAAVRSVRLDILKVFGFALGVTSLISLYLAGTIARPISRLADAAERVRYGQGRQTTIPVFSRRDEIGDLSRALRDMTGALWDRIDAIERFAADVAHEIKNPLTSLRSAVETALRVEDPARQRRLMAIIADDVQRLDRLITDISDASRLDAELSRSEIGRVDIGRMLQMLAALYSATVEANEPRIEVRIPENQTLEVLGSETRLVQVLENLIGNALSFSPPGGVVTLAAARQGRLVRIQVSDEGPGIPPGKLEAVFERFYTERPPGEKFGTHSGLGLSISKQIVEAHGGSIRAENRVDRPGQILGARFTVTLPAA